MTSAQQQATLTAANCDIVFDNLTRQLYATDASIYQIEPVGVAFPRNARQASEIIKAAAQTGITVTPRGAGTGLTGGALGEGLIIDFSRHNREITDVDLERRTVRVGPGVVLEALNNFLRPYGFRFGPDGATTSRARLGLVCFASVAEAMQATVEVLDLKPAAIEHLDRVLLDQTKGQLEFLAARNLLDLDHKPCQSVLVVEFFDDVSARLFTLAKRKLGLRTTIIKTAAEADLVWSLRKAGLSLLTGCSGDAKPVTGIEDAAVRPEQLPEYVAGLQKSMAPLRLQASFYGHAAAGLLHVRPVLDLHSAEDLQKFRQVADEVLALVRQVKRPPAGGHGVCIAPTGIHAEQQC